MKILNLKTLSFWGIVSLLIGGPTASAGVRYLHGDHLGSTSLTSNVNGTIVESAAYSPFGELLSEKGKGSPLPYLYTSQELDRSTDLYYYGARYYDPTLARFTSVDPIFDGLNPYAYVSNNPIALTDPTGRSPFGEALEKAAQLFESFKEAILDTQQRIKQLEEGIEKTTAELNERMDEKRAILRDLEEARKRGNPLTRLEEELDFVQGRIETLRRGLEVDQHRLDTLRRREARQIRGLKEGLARLAEESGNPREFRWFVKLLESKFGLPGVLGIGLAVHELSQNDPNPMVVAALAGVDPVDQASGHVSVGWLIGRALGGDPEALEILNKLIKDPWAFFKALFFGIDPEEKETDEDLQEP